MDSVSIAHTDLWTSQTFFRADRFKATLTRIGGEAVEVRFPRKDSTGSAIFAYVVGRDVLVPLPMIVWGTCLW
jgi:hypothetical protein